MEPFVVELNSIRKKYVRRNILQIEDIQHVHIDDSMRCCRRRRNWMADSRYARNAQG